MFWRERLCRGGSGRGRGARSWAGGKGTGWGERDPLGEVPERPGDPGMEERPPPAPQQSERHVAFLPASSPCASTTPQCPRKKQKATPPQTERGSGAGPGVALAGGAGEGGGRDPAPRVAHSPGGCLGPSPSLPQEQVCEGAAAQRGGGRGRRQIAKRGNPFRPSWKGGKGKGERKGRKKGGRGELG